MRHNECYGGFDYDCGAGAFLPPTQPYAPRVLEYEDVSEERRERRRELRWLIVAAIVLIGVLVVLAAVPLPWSER